METNIKYHKNKLYNPKAESFSEISKTHTPVPTIDPLSRRIAEQITQRELEILGIKPTESQPKKFFTLPQRPEESFIAPKPKTAPKLKVKVSVSGIHSDMQITNEELEDLRHKRQKTQETILSLENLKAFKEELNKDYPELGLNHSVDVSSFHTNELKELEEACKEIASECSEHKIKAEACEFSSSLSKIPNKTESVHKKNEKKPNSHKKAVKEKTSHKECEILTWPSVIKNSLTPSPSKIRAELTPSPSKLFSCQSELPTNDFLNLQTSFAKASFLHAPQEPIKNSVPRCHLDLTTGRATPVYFNTQVSPGQKVKTSNGIGQADSFRHLILNEKQPLAKLEPTDMYSKHLKWLNSKKNRDQQKKESLDLYEMQNCTFSPFEVKKKTESEVADSKFLSATTRFSLDSKEKKEFKGVKEQKDLKNPSFSMTRPKSSVVYTRLSPAKTRFGYSAGCDVNKLVKKSQPMVDYKRINALD